MASPEDSGEHDRPYQRRSDYKIEVLSGDLQRMAEEFHAHRLRTEKCLGELKRELSAVNSTVQAGKVAFWVLGGLGAIIAWVLSSWTSIKRIFGD